MKICKHFVQWSDYHLDYRASIKSKSVREKTEEELYQPITAKIRKNQHHILEKFSSQYLYTVILLLLKVLERLLHHQQKILKHLDNLM